MRIVLADDHALFRDGVSSLLQAWGHDVVGRAADGGEAIALVLRLDPDLVLMDVRMPGMSGVQATREIAAIRPELAIVMLTVSEDEEDLFAAIRAGARGYLLKDLEAAQPAGDDRCGRPGRGGDHSGHRGSHHPPSLDDEWIRRGAGSRPIDRA